MKVLFQIRPDYLKNPAGDTVQMISTGQGLKNSGVEIAISTDPNQLLSSFDLVHIFNITRIKESYLFFLNAQKQQKKVVISPIYWNPGNFLQSQKSGPNLLAAWKIAQPMRARLIRESRLILPNSELEMDNLKQDFPKHAPYLVIPNGFPDSFPGIGPGLFQQRFPKLPKDFILCVARISPRKNQHWLARICHESRLPLVLIGPVNDRKYLELIRSYNNVTYLGSQQGELLSSAYAAAKVHALPSWFETPGLSSLEAGACGTRVLSTNQGSPYEYFKDLAAYVQPLDDNSLRSGLEKALEMTPLPLTEHIREHYPWSRVSALTLAAYQTLVQ
ncbi:MAG TPA: glycosyltransferase [Desulfitobacteriaceae bacterium]|nr:glycosyltransferase [Desulfitobacteriaceae bacterium]